MSVGSADHWSQHSGLYASLVENATAPYARYIGLALAQLPQKQNGSNDNTPVRVLDIGCGPGVASIEAARRLGERAHVTATDFSAGMVERCTEALRAAGISNASASVADALALPFADASFDVVISNFAVGILREAESARAWSEAWRVVAPGGHVLVTSWSMDRDVGAFPAQIIMFKSIMAARQTPDAPLPVFETADALRAKLTAALPNIERLRIVDCRSSFVLSVNAIATMTLDNPGLMALVGGLSPDDRAAFLSRLTAFLVEATHATDLDEPQFMGAAANLSIVTKAK
jgi:ubiquinone/menaquinone biosynthesis C-methylase UbiE